ncbi:metallo-beta-lactamase domain-containing protein 1-like [Salvelinus namaycush]|uniref:Metallo-beta-lactamase domain-containing protein 1-like n=1 Tax=Salvelinus namaycush TaxID=8040 RepID=A0A8U0PWS0_SALNM|nr:metallo-beta-lactamase domain-containing protein 1-like [Salvelinus namaycush]
MEATEKNNACNSSEFRRSELSDTELEIVGQPYSISVLKVGYCLSEQDGSFRADGTISLLTGPRTILVDTGGPWDRDFLVKRLKDKRLDPGDISLVSTIQQPNNHNSRSPKMKEKDHHQRSEDRGSEPWNKPNLSDKQAVFYDI